MLTLHVEVMLPLSVWLCDEHLKAGQQYLILPASSAPNSALAFYWPTTLHKVHRDLFKKQNQFLSSFMYFRINLYFMTMAQKEVSPLSSHALQYRDLIYGSFSAHSLIPDMLASYLFPNSLGLHLALCFFQSVWSVLPYRCDSVIWTPVWCFQICLSISIFVFALFSMMVFTLSMWAPGKQVSPVSSYTVSPAPAVLDVENPGQWLSVLKEE